MPSSLLINFLPLSADHHALTGCMEAGQMYIFPIFFYFACPINSQNFPALASIFKADLPPKFKAFSG
jgi:hypothetical protein